MKKLGAVIKAFQNPVEGLIVIFSLGIFVLGVYMMAPAYATNYVTPVSATIQGNFEHLLGLIFAFMALPGLSAPFVRVNRRARSLKTATFGIFLIFLFLTILRIAFVGLVPFTWLPLLMLSLAGGYLHVWLKVRKE